MNCKHAFLCIMCETSQNIKKLEQIVLAEIDKWDGDIPVAGSQLRRVAPHKIFKTIETMTLVMKFLKHRIEKKVKFITDKSPLLDRVQSNFRYAAVVPPAAKGPTFHYLTEVN